MNIEVKFPVDDAAIQSTTVEIKKEQERLETENKELAARLAANKESLQSLRELHVVLMRHCKHTRKGAKEKGHCGKCNCYLNDSFEEEK